MLQSKEPYPLAPSPNRDRFREGEPDRRMNCYASASIVVYAGSPSLRRAFRRGEGSGGPRHEAEVDYSPDLKRPFGMPTRSAFQVGGGSETASAGDEVQLLSYAAPCG